MSLSPGNRIGHYDVTALLGEGGMGQVWQATDTQLNRDVALKVLLQAFTSDPDLNGVLVVPMSKYMVATAALAQRVTIIANQGIQIGHAVSGLRRATEQFNKLKQQYDHLREQALGKSAR